MTHIEGLRTSFRYNRKKGTWQGIVQYRENQKLIWSETIPIHRLTFQDAMYDADIRVRDLKALTK